MPNLSIKNVPEEVVARLRARAKANHRSLQGELLDLACRAVDSSVSDVASERHLRRKAVGQKSIEQIAAEHRARRETVRESAPSAADLIRKDRDAR